MPAAVVVGAGVLGSSVADRLARSGWTVDLLERFAPGTPRSGSGDDSRLIRCAHGADAWHARSARRALDLWRELDPSLVVETGIAWLARRPDGWEAEAERVLTSLGIETARVEAGSLYPSIREDDLAFTLLEPGAGVLRARAATRALAARAVDAGARLRSGVTARPDGARVVCDDGATLEADVVVWACGAWLGPLFGDLALRLRITQQDVFWFAAPSAWASPGVPGWVDYDGSAYGHGDLDGQGMKVAPDVEGPLCDPDAPDRAPLPQHLAAARAYLDHRFPALAGAPLSAARVCHYEITPDTRFLAAPHPEHDGTVWLLGGGSGHAFKHGPALAEWLEPQLAGEIPPDPLLGLADRATDISLRTAGR